MAAEPFVLLSDILSKDVPIDWYEAVAVVQEVCAGLSRPDQSPDPECIRLHSSGAIDLLPSRPTEPALRRLGFTLTALLQDAAPPAELRLIAAEMTSSLPPKETIADFSRRLSYFERPARTRILQLLYERSVIALAAAQARAARNEPTPVVQPEAVSHAARERVRRLPKAYAVAGATLIAAVIAAAASRYVPATRSFPASTVGKARSAAESLVVHSVASGRALLAQAGVISDSKTAAEHPTTASPELKTRSTSQRVDRAGSNAPSDTKPPVAVHVPSTPAVEAPIPEPVVAASDSPAVTGPDLTVYSSADSDVLPPTLVSRQLPKTIAIDANGEPSGTAGEAVLTVDQNGNVASVKIVSMPQQFQPRMLVSAMKAWRYRPALKDGKAVRYAVRVRIPF